MLDEYEERREREDLLENRLNEIRKRPGNQLTGGLMSFLNKEIITNYYCEK